VNRKRVRFALALFDLLMGNAGQATAQSWPEKAVTIIMGFPAGSGVDVVARLLQGPMEKESALSPWPWGCSELPR
jgi:tripartite-type tricarboxylate transporter receptor subunit TctC